MDDWTDDVRETVTWPEVSLGGDARNHLPHFPKKVMLISDIQSIYKHFYTDQMLVLGRVFTILNLRCPG